MRLLTETSTADLRIILAAANLPSAKSSDVAYCTPYSTMLTVSLAIRDTVVPENVVSVMVAVAVGVGRTVHPASTSALSSMVSLQLLRPNAMAEQTNRDRKIFFMIVF